MGHRLRTTDAALEYLWAGTGRRASTCVTTALDPGVLAKTQTHTDTRGRPHDEHGVESIAWHRDLMGTSTSIRHTSRRR
jgi:hypothetical protein